MLTALIAYKQYVAVVIALSLILVAYLKRTLSYWSNQNVPSIRLGNFRDITNLVEKPYHYFKSAGHKFFGAFLLVKPLLVVIDLELSKTILTKNFQHFTSHGTYYNENDDPLSAHLFNLEGTRWKNLRAKLTPTFTSGKMKMMFQTLLDCSKQLMDYVEDSATNSKPLDIKEVLACFTTDIIGSCAFGLDCNSFVTPNSKFRRYGKKLFESDYLKSAKLGLFFLFPNLARKLKMKILEADISDFFYNIINNSVEYRVKNNVTRKDFLQLLMELKNSPNLDGDIKKEFDNSALSMQEIAAQALLFFLAGFETSSTTMTYCLYELCTNIDIQEKVRNEIDYVLSKHDGKITYDGLLEMTYMQQVIDETLRKYPPVPLVFRKCTEDYTLPDTDVKIRKDVLVFIPTYQIHHDREYYPEPEEFKPERFGEENRKNIPQFAFLPFGEGPRICIGLRFGIMQTKVGLTTLLKNFRFTLNQKTPYPLKFNPNTVILTSQENIYLDAVKVN